MSAPQVTVTQPTVVDALNPEFLGLDNSPPSDAYTVFPSDVSNIEDVLTLSSSLITQSPSLKAPRQVGDCACQENRRYCFAGMQDKAEEKIMREETL